jgi:hypothetical protein
MTEEQPSTEVATATMEKAEFEKRFLALVAQTNIVITAANIAYHLEVPIEEAQDQLLGLELNGVIQQQTDENGNTHYVMPNRPAPGTLPVHLRTEQRGEGGQAGPTPGIQNPADLPAAPIYHSPGAKGRNVNGLVLNVVLPGVGSLVCGRMAGLGMLGLLLLGIVMFFLPLGFGRLLGILPIVASWIWSIVAGVGLLNEKER